MNYDYSDIAPYENRTFHDAIDRLKQYPQLMENFTDIISRHGRLVNAYRSLGAKKQLRAALDAVNSYDDFQRIITCNIFLDTIEKSSIDNLTVGGVENLDDKPHVYISNHRDIVLDTALLDYVLNKNGRQMCEMVIGDNLLVNQFVTDLFKVNGAITVKRTASSSSELKNITEKLSSYLIYCVTEKKKSIWIAQKSGRSKDGIDNTSPAIFKMMYLDARNNGVAFSDFLNRMSVVPVSISYQYDPCDVTKSHEQIKKLKAEGCYDVYKKKKYADILDMVRGLRLYKGNVHIQLGKPLCASIDNVRDAVRETDRQIHENYRLWNTNWLCYDILEKQDSNADKYKDLNKSTFLKKYSGYGPEVLDYVLNQYANPVRSMLNEKNS